MLKKVIDILKFVINKYELKHPEYAKPVFICPNIKTRIGNKILIRSEVLDQFLKKNEGHNLKNKYEVIAV